MFTSYYANVQKIVKAGLRPVAISRGIPKWFTGEVEQRLAPTWQMLKMSREDYDKEFRRLLKRLDPKKIYEVLGDDAVLLCYEKPNEWCHRRLVAEWLEESLGIEIPEFGFTREKTLPYELCGREQHKERKLEPIKTEQPEPIKIDFEQMELKLW